MNSNVYEERKKFNIIDALIILLIVVMMLVIIFRAQLIALFNDSGTKKEVVISFVCESIPQETMTSVTNNSTLIWVEPNVSLGKLTITSPVENAKVFYYEGGELFARISETEKSFKGTIHGTAVSDNGCYIDGSDFIAAGMTVLVTNGQAQFNILITDVTFK